MSRNLTRAASLTLVILLSLVLFPAIRASAAWDGGHDVFGSLEPHETWYFAEGTTRAGFDEWLCLLNPGTAEASATVTYMLASGQTIDKSYGIKAASRLTVDVRADVPAGSDVSARVTSSRPIVTERPIYFRYKGSITGGHDVMGANAPAAVWYFAEGTCRPGFDSYFCMQNPSGGTANVRITYMLGDSSTRQQVLEVPARSRRTVAAADALGVADDAAHDFSAKVESTGGVGIVVERPMYFSYKGAITGGHDVMGAPGPSGDWYFAEGTCRPGFDPYICVQNPGETRADVRITYMRGDATTRSQSLALRPHSRSTVAVASVLGSADDAAHDFSAKVESTGGAGIVVERPMYFAYKSAINGGHDVMGAGAASSRWYFAEGTCRPGFDPYLCIMNPGAKSADVGITYMLADGSARAQSVSVAANSRSTVAVKQFLGEADDAAHDFSAKVETTTGAGIVVERPVYFSYNSTAKGSLSAVGDVNLGGDMVPLLQSCGFNPWAGVADLLGGATLAFANLECAISYRGEPVPGKTFTFRGPPDGLPPMRAAGIDVVSQANNHARDFGGTALTDSLGYLDTYGIGHCGAGSDLASAHAPALLDANGLRVAFLAYNDIGYDGFSGWPAAPGYPGIANAADTRQIAADVAAARAASDLVVVSFHWGTERKYTPDPRQVQLGHYAVDCGADLVLGQHPHVAQGFELYRGKPIAYSLGNFVFSPGSEAGHYTVLARFSLDSRGFGGVTVYPVYISGGRPAVLGGSGGQSLLGQVASLSSALGTPMTVHEGYATVP